LDPTTGEINSLSATHIKLFEGMGGVVPDKVEVTAFEPQTSEWPTADLAARTELPWKTGQKYQYRYTQGEQELGFEKFSIDKIGDGETEHFVVRSNLDLTASGTRVLMETTLEAQTNGRPSRFERKATVGENTTTVRCKFDESGVSEIISGSVRLQKDVSLPENIYCFDNNFVASFGLMSALWPLRGESSFEVETYHPSSLQVIRLGIDVGLKTEFDWQGQKVPGFVCDVKPIKNRFFISESGQLLRVTQGALVIELQSDE
jgi:hypothetical protein